jgi:NADPH2:quinone reductase
MESFVTAFEVVVHLAKLQRGQAILIQGAAGGIGSACVQVADGLGAKVYATAAAARIADVIAIGTDAVFNYRTEDFEQAVMRTTNGAGVDAVIDD